MKILLAACNAKYIHSNLAVYNLRAYAEDYRKNIVLKEYTINQQKDEILRDIYLEKPDVICFSCYIWNISFVKEIAEDLKKILPDSVFWAGGPEVSFETEKFLKENPAFFGVMVGEGERTFLELCRYYRQHQRQADRLLFTGEHHLAERVVDQNAAYDDGDIAGVVIAVEHERGQHQKELVELEALGQLAQQEVDQQRQRQKRQHKDVGIEQHRGSPLAQGVMSNESGHPPFWRMRSTRSRMTASFCCACSTLVMRY